MSEESKYFIHVTVEDRDTGVDSIALAIDPDRTDIAGALLTMMAGVCIDLIGIKQVEIRPDGTKASIDMPVSVLKENYLEVNQALDSIEISDEDKKRIIEQIEKQLGEGEDYADTDE
tara:strand:+ start:69 stop:419 length:351 start_codon:yes stop_codon:yes gene_type:complete